MTTTKTEKVIGLWLDAIGGDEPKWIVSRDTFVGDEPDTSTTTMTFGEHEYEAARDFALDLAAEKNLRLIRTGRHGERKCLFTPLPEAR